MRCDMIRRMRLQDVVSAKDELELRDLLQLAFARQWTYVANVPCGRHNFPHMLSPQVVSRPIFHYPCACEENPSKSRSRSAVRGSQLVIGPSSQHHDLKLLQYQIPYSSTNLQINHPNPPSPPSQPQKCPNPPPPTPSSGSTAK